MQAFAAMDKQSMKEHLAERHDVWPQAGQRPLPAPELVELHGFLHARGADHAAHNHDPLIP